MNFFSPDCQKKMTVSSEKVLRRQTAMNPIELAVVTEDLVDDGIRFWMMRSWHLLQKIQAEETLKKVA